MLRLLREHGALSERQFEDELTELAGGQVGRR
jgi:hypothetical protein